MADRRSWEYQTVMIHGDLAQLNNVCIDGWRFKMICERQPDTKWICLLEREVSLIIT